MGGYVPVLPYPSTPFPPIGKLVQKKKIIKKRKLPFDPRSVPNQLLRDFIQLLSQICIYDRSSIELLTVNLPDALSVEILPESRQGKRKSIGSYEVEAPNTSDEGYV